MSSSKYGHKKQHFVLACYLKAWLDPSAPRCSTRTPYLWMFDKDGSSARNEAPEKIFRETDIYTVRMPDGSHNLKLEQKLAELETTFSRIRTSKFNYRRELTGAHWHWVCSFAAFAQNRTVATRDHFFNQFSPVKELFEREAGPDWATRPKPVLPPDVDQSKGMFLSRGTSIT